jgi:hypothetical protein
MTPHLRCCPGQHLWDYIPGYFQAQITNCGCRRRLRCEDAHTASRTSCVYRPLCSLSKPCRFLQALPFGQKCQPSSRYVLSTMLPVRPGRPQPSRINRAYSPWINMFNNPRPLAWAGMTPHLRCCPGQHLWDYIPGYFQAYITNCGCRCRLRCEDANTASRTSCVYRPLCSLSKPCRFLQALPFGQKCQPSSRYVLSTMLPVRTGTAEFIHAIVPQALT